MTIRSMSLNAGFHVRFIQVRLLAFRKDRITKQLGLEYSTVTEGRFWVSLWPLRVHDVLFNLNFFIVNLRIKMEFPKQLVGK